MAKAYGFKDRDVAETLKAIARNTPAEYKAGSDQLRMPVTRQWVAKVTTEITARSSNTPGTGEVSLQRLDDNGDFTDFKTEVTVKNWTATAVAVDQWIIVGTFLGIPGKWVTGEDCS